MMNTSYMNKSGTVWGPPYTGSLGQTAPVAPPPCRRHCQQQFQIHYSHISMFDLTNNNFKYSTHTLACLTLPTTISNTLLTHCLAHLTYDCIFTVEVWVLLSIPDLGHIDCREHLCIIFRVAHAIDCACKTKPLGHMTVTWCNVSGL